MPADDTETARKLAEVEALLTSLLDCGLPFVENNSAGALPFVRAWTLLKRPRRTREGLKTLGSVLQEAPQSFLPPSLVSPSAAHRPV